MRTKIAGPFNISDVKFIKVTKAGGETIELAKGEKDWTIKTPKEMAGDNNNVGIYLDRMSKLQMTKVTEPESVTPEFLKEKNLEPASAVVEFKESPEKTVQSFKVGLTRTNIYITMSDGAVGELDLNMWADVVPTLKYFRDRRVMRNVTMGDFIKIRTKSGRVFQKEGANWYATDAQTTAAATPAAGASPAAASTATPEKASDKDAAQVFSDWEFLLAEDIVDGDAVKNLKTYGLDKPITTFTLESADDKKLKEEILVGSRVPGNEKQVYVKRSGSPDVYAVETGWLDALTRMDGGKSPQAQK